jgi:hypothetical protein
MTEASRHDLDGLLTLIVAAVVDEMRASQPGERAGAQPETPRTPVAASESALNAAATS